MSQKEGIKLMLDASIPANNYKIIEIYNKVRKGEWDIRPAFQRKLVWKKQHKINFIETILLNYPFPEIYIAPGEMDSENLTIIDVVVDGQQRTSTIVNYIEAKDIFSQNSSKIPAFKDLEEMEKRAFLNFEVSIRYLKNATQEQIKNIFQRINSSEYSLNQVEKHHAQYGDSEFMLFAKQIVESDKDLDYGIINYKLKDENKQLLHNFFVKESGIFSNNDLDRMFALQYMMTILSTMIEDGNYFHRVSKNEAYLESYNGEFDKAYIYEGNLVDIISFIKKLDLKSDSIWFSKSSMFTLIIELYKFRLENKGSDFVDINEIEFKDSLHDLNKKYHLYFSDKDSYVEELTGEILYFQGSRQGVNDAEPRTNRGRLVQKFIEKAYVK